MQSAMFAVKIAREMTRTHRGVNLRQLEFFLHGRSVRKCYFIYWNYCLSIKSGLRWYFSETVASEFSTNKEKKTAIYNELLSAHLVRKLSVALG